MLGFLTGLYPVGFEGRIHYNTVALAEVLPVMLGGNTAHNVGCYTDFEAHSVSLCIHIPLQALAPVLCQHTPRSSPSLLHSLYNQLLPAAGPIGNHKGGLTYPKGPIWSPVPHPVKPR